MRATVVVLLAGCASGADVQWIEGFSYDWNLFNHRLSTLSARARPDDVLVTVIGGTSTTAYVFDEGDCTSKDDCQELPFIDNSAVELRLAHATVDAALTGSGSLTADRAGTNSEIVIPSKRPLRGDMTAIIAGVSLSTSLPLLTPVAPSCYDPRHGWNPREITIALGKPGFSDGAVRVPVAARFSAGNTLEEIRVCVDEAAPYAQVQLDLDVVVIGGRGDTVTTTTSQAQTFAFDPSLPQDPPAEVAWTPAFPGGVAGWSKLSWTFHADDPEGRGAYLRSLTWKLDPDEGVAYGAATNRSATMLSGFSYTFEGEIIERDADVERGVEVYAAEDVPAELDSSGIPVPYTWPILRD